MSKRILIGLSMAVIAAVGVGCSQRESANANANANTVATTTTRPAPDNSEVMTTIDANGVKTETRTFQNNPRVSKVVVTTRNGQRTVRAYSKSGEEKDVNDVGDALVVTGDKIADAAGWVAGKGKDVAGATKKGTTVAGEKTVEAAKTVGSKTAGAAKTVGSKTADTAKTVGEKTAEGAKTVGEKTKEGVEKTGKALKKIIP